jgi:hypothetical protein
MFKSFKPFKKFKPLATTTLCGSIRASLEERKHRGEQLQCRLWCSARRSHFSQACASESPFAGPSKVQAYCLRSGGLPFRSPNNPRQLFVDNVAQAPFGYEARQLVAEDRQKQESLQLRQPADVRAVNYTESSAKKYVDADIPAC